MTGGTVQARAGRVLTLRRPGRGKVIELILNMPGVQRATGRQNRVTRRKDKLSYWYEKTVTDEKTGEVLHHQAHSLREHVGHGDDRGPRRSPPPQVAQPEARGLSQ